jgi:group I intron endonuclease
MFGYIYITTNLINDKKYIGKRYGAFDSTYYGSGTILKKAIEKYGLKNFNTVLLKECCNEEDINKSEKILIRVLNPEYNIAEGGAGGNTLLHASDDHKLEVIKKRSISLKKAWDRKDRKKWGKAISEAKKVKGVAGLKHILMKLN